MTHNIIPIPEKWRTNRFLAVPYWLAHYIAVNVVAIKHGCWKPHFLLHDIDKPIKLLLGIPYCTVQREHLLKPHHAVNDLERFDILEALCDWQASGYTKPDSLLDARETCRAYHPELYDVIKPVMDKYNF